MGTEMAFENEIGAQPPLGFFDPLGLLKDADQARFNRLRTVEIKHGRVSQLAFIGHLFTQVGIRFADIPPGLAAIGKIPIAGMSQLFFLVGFLELVVWKQQEGSFPGDLSATNFFPVGFVGQPSEEDKIELRAKELNQGRAAMMGILALMVHEELNGMPYIFFDPAAL